VELPFIKKCAVACLDKTMQIWQFEQQKCLMVIDFPHGGIHTMVFSEAYQVILTAGYENHVKLTSFDFKNLVFFLISGEQPLWRAHRPLLDDLHAAGHQEDAHGGDRGRPEQRQGSALDQVWDIRKLNCIQTIVLDTKNSISMILDIQTGQKIGFLGQRVNLLEWDHPLPQDENLTDK